jgi:phosphate transport system protein
MREEYRAELAQVAQILVSMAQAARRAMRRATGALLSADQSAAEGVLRDDVEIDRLRAQVEERAFQLLARQAPVASDLRLVVTAMRVAADLERMGDLAGHVAKTALRRVPAFAVPAELAPVITHMGEVADRIAAKIIQVLETMDASRAAELEHDDDAMDELHRQIFAVILEKTWPYGVEHAIDVTLLGRWYERFADHAVNAGRQVIYLVTGHAPPAG